MHMDSVVFGVLLFQFFIADFCTLISINKNTK